MKRIAVAVLLSLTAVCGAQAGTASAKVAPSVAAEGSPGGVAALCTETSAVWSAEAGAAGLTPVSPRGDNEIATWQCRVGHQRLVVRHRTCSATMPGAVSAWVNGIKVIRIEPIGDLEQCGARAGKDVQPIVLSITLGRDGRLTVCRLQGRAEEEKQVCEIVRHGGQRDPAYYPPGSSRSDERL